RGDTATVRSHGDNEGVSSGSTNLLPAPGPSTDWTSSLVMDSGHDSDLIFRSEGQQMAEVPDRVVPQKETLLCNSDKTVEKPRSLTTAV
ncbi:hypothetical protein NHX12_008561, partial [Muraenolepis orangiensis]